MTERDTMYVVSGILFGLLFGGGVVWVAGRSWWSAGILLLLAVRFVWAALGDE